jgi:hypothetical protein
MEVNASSVEGRGIACSSMETRRPFDTTDHSGVEARVPYNADAVKTALNDGFSHCGCAALTKADRATTKKRASWMWLACRLGVISDFGVRPLVSESQALLDEFTLVRPQFGEVGQSPVSVRGCFVSDQF